MQGAAAGKGLTRILLDECVDERLRFLFETHDCRSARHAGLAGLTNGQMLIAAEAAGFEAIVTMDRKMRYQQNLTVRNIAILVLAASTNRLADLTALVPGALQALESIAPGQVVTVS